MRWLSQMQIEINYQSGIRYVEISEPSITSLRRDEYRREPVDPGKPVVGNQDCLAGKIVRTRSDGDRRPDVVVKKEILYELKKDGWDPWLCLDDRNAVVAMWRREGVTCLQVADGDF